MALVVNNTAEGIMLDYILNKDVPEELSIRLYSNDYSPIETDTVGSYTEVTGGGYAAQSLTPGNWTVVTGAPSAADHTVITWTFSASVGNVYGYYITRDTGGELMWAERFTNGPFNIANNGDQISVTPRITLE